MARQLVVVRHAKSAWDSGAASDFERPLAKRGREEAPRVGRWLAQEGLVPDRVVSSPAERAKRTAIAICEELEIARGSIRWEPRVYAAGVETLLQVLADCPAQAGTVMLVGHNPGLEELVDYLCPEVPIPEDGKLLPTAAVACLRMPQHWGALEAGVAELVTVARPGRPGRD